jgi:small subunit ribosomal protein S9
MITAKKNTIKKEAKKETKEDIEHYFKAVGRRKTAVARVRLFTQGDKTILVNDKSYKEYFPILELQQIIDSPLDKMKALDKFKIIAKVRGGGFHAQAEAIRHGISRALVEFNPDFRKRLRRVGYLTRDPRMRERKKFGLKRARRAPQWSKR